MKQRKAMFAIMVTEDELDILKMDAELLRNCEDEKVSELGKRMTDAVKRVGKKLGFRYEHL